MCRVGRITMGSGPFIATPSMRARFPASREASMHGSTRLSAERHAGVAAAVDEDRS